MRGGILSEKYRATGQGTDAAPRCGRSASWEHKEASALRRSVRMRRRVDVDENECARKITPTGRAAVPRSREPQGTPDAPRGASGRDLRPRGAAPEGSVNDSVRACPAPLGSPRRVRMLQDLACCKRPRKMYISSRPPSKKKFDPTSTVAEKCETRPLPIGPRADSPGGEGRSYAVSTRHKSSNLVL